MGSFTFRFVFFTSIFLCALLPQITSAQFSISESFRGSSPGKISIGGTAKLTSGDEDPVGDGWLRLTPLGEDKVGWGVLNESFPAQQGFTINFEYNSWGGSGADGISVFLYDASVSMADFHIGGIGGSLGYAPNDGRQPAQPGLSGGYLGIGLDEFGNFSDPSEGRNGGPGLRKNSIAVRGPAPEYRYLAGTGDNNSSSLQQKIDMPYVPSRPAAAAYYRRIRFVLQPAGTGKYHIEVWWQTSANTAFTKLLEHDIDYAPPPFLKIGFASSTGGSTNYHEIRNLHITTPGGVRLEKFVDKLYAGFGEKLVYQVHVINAGENAVVGLPLGDTLKDQNGHLLPLENFQITSVTFHNNGNPANTASGFPNGQPVAQNKNHFEVSDLRIAAKEDVFFVVEGRIGEAKDGAALMSIQNFAVVDPLRSNKTDPDFTNNMENVSTYIVDSSVVDFRSFTAQLIVMGEAYLQWKVENEFNVQEYVIEKSSDGKYFTQIATVPFDAKAGKIYQYTDKNLAEGTTYYRIHQVGLRGADVFSDLRQVSFHPRLAEWSLFPNPSVMNLTLQVRAVKQLELTVWILDNELRRVSSAKVYSLSIGRNAIEIDVSALQSGIYYLACKEGSNAIRYLKFLKARARR